MPSTRVLAVLVAGLFASTPACRRSPTSATTKLVFQQTHWGMSKADLKLLFPDVEAPPTEDGGFAAEFLTRRGDVNGNPAMVMFNFNKDRLAEVLVAYDGWHPPSLDDIKKGLVVAYGEPASSSEGSHAWSDGVASIDLSKGQDDIPAVMFEYKALSTAETLPEGHGATPVVDMAKHTAEPPADGGGRSLRAEPRQFGDQSAGVVDRTPPTNRDAGAAESLSLVCFPYKVLMNGEELAQGLSPEGRSAEARKLPKVRYAVENSKLKAVIGNNAADFYDITENGDQRLVATRTQFYAGVTEHYTVEIKKKELRAVFSSYRVNPAGTVSMSGEDLSGKRTMAFYYQCRR